MVMSCTAENYALNPFSPMKALVHSERLEAVVNGKIAPPVLAAVDLSNSCNHDCKWCLYREYNAENPAVMSKQMIKELVSDVERMNVKVVCLSGGGEPLVNRHAGFLINECHKRGIGITLNTNGGLLENVKWDSLKKLKYVRISLDSGSDETHYKLHRPKNRNRKEWSRILGTIKKIAKHKKRPHIGIGYLVHPLNIKEMYHAAKSVKAVGADYIQMRPLKNVPISEIEWRDIAMQIQKSRELEDETFKVHGTMGKAKTYKSGCIDYCHMCKIITSIAPDGSVYPCCELRGKSKVGDLNEKRFSKIWGSRKHIRVLKNLDYTKCPPCKYFETNELIEQVFVRDVLHRNFL